MKYVSEIKRFELMKKTGTVNPLNASDYIDRDALKTLQLSRLRTMVRHAYDHVALFRGRMFDLGLKPDDIQSLEDLQKLPFMVKKTCATPIPSDCSPFR